MKDLIRHILKEDSKERFINYAVEYLKKSPPYFKKLRDLGINKKSEIRKILKQIFPNLDYIDETTIFNKRGDEIYSESNPDFYADNEIDWEKHEYNKNGDVIYHERTDDGILSWERYEYNENGEELYYENSDNVWWKWDYKYDKNSKTIRYSDSEGIWKIFIYDNQGNLKYEEDSRQGILTDER